MKNTFKNKTDAEGRKQMFNWVPSPGAMPASSKDRIKTYLSAASPENRKGKEVY